MHEREIHDLLAEHAFFADLPEADLDLIAGCGTNLRWRPGEVLVHEGAHADTFYVLRRGKVAIELHAPHHRSIVLATHGPGEVVGWAWLVPPHRWPYDVRAVEDTSAVALDGACLRGKCDADTDLGYRLMQRFARLASDHLQATRLQLLDLYGSPAGGRDDA